MSTLTQKDVEHIFEALRKGLVPERGLDTFAVGIEKQRGELSRATCLTSAEPGDGSRRARPASHGCPIGSGL
jgi:hypothetical protein